jgi:propionyl-CoA synthetase
LPVKIGSPGVPMPGYDVQILDEDGHPNWRPANWAPSRSSCRCRRAPADAVERRRPLRRILSAPLPRLLRDRRCGLIDEDGYLYIMARTDDVINVAGHRLSTGAMEEVLAAHPDVAECAVIGVADDLKGQLPMGFLCLNARRRPGRARDRRRMREAGARPDRPGRGVQAGLRGPPPAQDPLGQDPARHHGQDRRWRKWKMPATIDDPAILDEIAQALRGMGYAQADAAR